MKILVVLIVFALCFVPGPASFAEQHTFELTTYYPEPIADYKTIGIHGNDTLNSTPAFKADGSDNFSNGLIVTNLNRVGIGNTLPSTALEISGMTKTAGGLVVQVTDRTPTNLAAGRVWLDTSVPVNAGSSGGTWIQKKNLPGAGAGLASSVINGKIYVMGVGGNTVDASNAVYLYDPSYNSWVSQSVMAAKRFGLASSTVNGTIYAIGGYDYYATDAYLHTVEQNTLGGASWTNASALTLGGFYLTSAVVGGKIYAIGGNRRLDRWSSAGASSDVEEYNPATGIWTTKTSMPTARDQLTSSVVNEKIYVIGGNNVSLGVSLNTVEEYDPATNSWRSRQPMPTARFGLTSSVVDGKIYAIGGHLGISWAAVSAVVEEYDPATNSWASKTSMPFAEYDLTSAVVDGKIYVIGSGRVLEYTPAPSAVDIGLRVYDGTRTINVACQPDTGVTSALRITRKVNNVMTVYGVMLVDTTDTTASRIRVKTRFGTKAIKKLN